MVLQSCAPPFGSDRFRGDPGAARAGYGTPRSPFDGSPRAVAHFQATLGLGTLAGGWRIIHTMGSRITKLQPVNGFAAETGAAGAIFLATTLGIPVSTTHAITGAFVGVGATRRMSAVRWGVAGQIVWAWVLTIPGAAIIAATSFWALHFFGVK